LGEFERRKYQERCAECFVAKKMGMLYFGNGVDFSVVIILSEGLLSSGRNMIK